MAAVAMASFTVLAIVVVFTFGDRSVDDRLADVAAIPSETVHYSVRDILSFISRPLGPFRRMFRLEGDEDLVYRLSLAGYRESQDIQTFLDAKLLCPVLGVLLATFAGGSNLLIYGMAGAAGGFFAPDLFVMRMTAKRKKSIARSLPDSVDMLVITMEAGLGMDQAILRVAKEFEPVAPALSEELMILSREQRAGKPRLEAWRSLSDRVDLDTVRQLVGMLTQSDRLGTPIARSLAEFSDALRTKRLMEAEERAAKTTVKLIFPLVLFIFPTMFIVILGPAALIIIKSFQEMSH